MSPHYILPSTAPLPSGIPMDIPSTPISPSPAPLLLKIPNFTLKPTSQLKIKIGLHLQITQMASSTTTTRTMINSKSSSASAAITPILPFLSRHRTRHNTDSMTEPPMPAQDLLNPFFVPHPSTHHNGIIVVPATAPHRLPLMPCVPESAAEADIPALIPDRPRFISSLPSLPRRRRSKKKNKKSTMVHQMDTIVEEELRHDDPVSRHLRHRRHKLHGGDNDDDYRAAVRRGKCWEGDDLLLVPRVVPSRDGTGMGMEMSMVASAALIGRGSPSPTGSFSSCGSSSGSSDEGYDDEDFLPEVSTFPILPPLSSPRISLVPTAATTNGATAGSPPSSPDLPDMPSTPGTPELESSGSEDGDGGRSRMTLSEDEDDGDSSDNGDDVFSPLSLTSPDTPGTPHIAMIVPLHSTTRTEGRRRSSTGSRGNRRMRSVTIVGFGDGMVG